MAERPWAVSAICVPAIILGAAGFLGAAAMAAGQVYQPKFSALQPDPKLARLNAEFERRSAEALAPTRPYFWALLPFLVGGAGLLLAGGVRGLKLRGRGLLVAAFAANVGIDAASAAIGIANQLALRDVMGWYAREMAAAANVPAGLLSSMTMGATVGVAFAAAWFLVKAGYYVLGIVVLGKPAVRAAFAPPA